MKVGPYSEGALEVKGTPFLSPGALDGVAAVGAGAAAREAAAQRRVVERMLCSS
jgi:hypothetical protein